MKYPHINKHIEHDELLDHFTLSAKERHLLAQRRKEVNILGVAVVLKSLIFLGFPPRSKEDIPSSVISWVSGQLDLDASLFGEYRWKDSVWKKHLATIRTFTGFRSCNESDLQELSQWLVSRAGKHHPSRQGMFSSAIQQCRQLRLELPAEKEFRRLVNSAWQQFLNGISQKITDRLYPEILEKMDRCLDTAPAETERYEWLKAHPGKFGMKSLKLEIKRLEFIKEFSIRSDIHLMDVPAEMLKLLRDRAFPEGAYQMKRHPPHIRYALMTILLHFRQMEVTDNIVGIFLHLIRRIDKKADQSLENKLIKNIKNVYGKQEILYKMAKATTQHPHDPVEDTVFPVVGEDVLYKIIEEYEGRELVYENSRAKEKKNKYSRFYRQMMKPVLETLVFRANNPAHKPLLDGIALVRKYLDKKHVHYPQTEEIPEDLLSGDLKEMANEEVKGIPRIVKHYFELAVLQKLEKALKCKEVWVEGAYRYRDPDQDLPQDWSEKRLNYYAKHQIPQRSEDFVGPIREELTAALEKANDFFGQKQDVYIYHPGNGETGFFRIPKIAPGPDHPILREIKQIVLDRWGILELVDILLEADRQVNFSKYFYSTAQRQVLSPSEIRERLLLSLLGRGTGLGLKRIHAAAKPNFSYEDLVYFNKRFVHKDSLREAISALVNRILEVRNPEIWGTTTACTSDGKYLGAWDQNMVTEWNPHYQKRGFLSYWHSDLKSAGIYSQVKGTSEVAAMIAGLIFHNTMSDVKSNYVDTGGQSAMGFSFCRFLGVELLPWLRRMKSQRLYLPDSDMKDRLPHLAGVLARPIRWGHVHTPYDDMVRHVVAAKEQTAPVDSILRRFNKNNPASLTHKGFIEAGKALKTIHNCNFLTDLSYRKKIHEGRNIIESWNSTIDFICYGGESEIKSNDPEVQELTVLCLHLLQNALVLVNTVVVERVLHDEGYIGQMPADDLNALTPLFTSNVNPYGDIHLDLNKPSFLQVN